MKYKFIRQSTLILILLMVIVAFTGYYIKSSEVILSPLAKEQYKLVIVKEVQAVDRNLIDRYVDVYSRKYAKNDTQYSWLKNISHCLLFYESKHGQAKGFGDRGLAGGISQFHQNTYVSYRNKMIKKGLVNNIGSRLDDENAIQTMIWAISNGYGKAWGPVLRGECK